MNGWKNNATWNVSLWMQNDEGLYAIARACRKSSTPYRAFVKRLASLGIDSTPDGVSYTASRLSIRELNACIREC